MRPASRMASPYPGWPEPGPARAPRPAGDRRAGRPDRGGRANVPRGAGIGPDALAGLEAEAEDREDDPAEAQGDDELAIVSAAWA